ncbi:MAG: VanW family protein [Clostridia bacterium]
MSKNNNLNDNSKNSKKTAINVKNNNKKLKIAIIVLLFISLVVVIVGQFIVYNNTLNNDGFYEGTKINGVNVSDMTIDDAANLLSTNLSKQREEIVIKLSYKDKSWVWEGKDFEVNSNIMPILESAYMFGRNGTRIEKLSIIKKIQSQGFNTDISYKYVLAGIDKKIENVISEIDKPAVEPQVKFYPNNKEMFVVADGENGVHVKKEELFTLLDQQFKVSPKVNIEIPFEEVLPLHTKSEVLANLKKRSSFSTSYKTSIPERKHNIQLALSKFNGIVVAPGEEVSFNDRTGQRSKENGYKKANVILNGVFVEGTGGGVCQASTTLYNAIIKADLDVVEVSKHTIPASYVPLAFDAMVSFGYSDLKFKNNLDFPVYFRAYGDDKNAYVEIYGKPFDSGATVQRRAEFVKVLPHKGDRIVKDVNYEYSDKVTYIGEYYRLKKPREGYESKAYLDYYVNGEKTGEKLLRHEIYLPQEGVIVEGVEELSAGMTLPENNVKIIPPQEASTLTENDALKKIEKDNPSKYGL